MRITWKDTTWGKIRELYDQRARCTVYLHSGLEWGGNDDPHFIDEGAGLDLERIPGVVRGSWRWNPEGPS